MNGFGNDNLEQKRKGRLKMKVKEIYFQITMTEFYHQQTCMRTSEEICTLGGRKILCGTERKRLNKVKSTALLRSIRELRSHGIPLPPKLEKTDR